VREKAEQLVELGDQLMKLMSVEMQAKKSLMAGSQVNLIETPAAGS
jgi:hypothetical protein